MPPANTTAVAAIPGPAPLPADHAEDFVIQKGDGYPTYHFACVVDDELMKITHVLRGQEHLINTPKHIALQRALGFAPPRYAHLSVIFNMDGTKMSKRDKEKAVKVGRQPPEIDVHDFRVAGYLPEAILNFIALLGWSPGDDREFFDLNELTQAFSIDRVGKTNARFDREKLLSFNTTWATRLSPDRLLGAFKDFIRVSESPMRCANDELLRVILSVCAGFRTFWHVEEKVRFLFLADDAIEYQPKAVQKVLAKNGGEGYAALAELLPNFRDLPDWSPGSVEWLIQSACERKGIPLGQIAQPLRVAVTGTTISPSIHDTLVLLGRLRVVARVARCLEGSVPEGP